jgi:hypothetical protein
MNRRSKVAILLTVLAAVISARPKYIVTGIAPLGGTLPFNEATGLNDSGQVVGCR